MSATASGPRCAGTTRPRPSRATPPRSRAATTCSSAATFVAPGDGTRVPTINPATEEPLAEVAFAGPKDVARAVEAARAAAPGWAGAAAARARQVPVPHRAADPGARARAGGRRVARRRQADPRVARRRRPARRRALLLLRGLGGQAAVRARRPRARAARRRRPGRAVELPAADGGVEARAGARHRQHRGAQAGRDDAADRAAAGRDLPGGRAARRRGQHRHRRRERGRRARPLRASTRSPSPARPRSARRSSARWPAPAPGLTLELGGKSANIVFEDAALDQAVEGIIEGIFFNQGHVCCAGSRLLLQESVAEEVVRKLWARMERLRVGDPLDKNTDVGAINSAAQLARIEALVDEGEREGATRRSVACALPETGYWFPPTLFLDVAPANRIAVEEIFGPVVSVTTFRTPGRGGRAREQLRLRARRGRVDRQRLEGVRGGVRAARRRRVAEHLQPVRPDGRVRRLQGERVRPRGRPGRTAAVREADVSRVAGRQDVQALRGRRVRALGVRPQRRGGGRQRPARARARTCATRSRPRAARRPAGRRGPPTTAARCSTASPRRWSRAARSSATTSARPSTCSSTTRAGPTSSPP